MRIRLPCVLLLILGTGLGACSSEKPDTAPAAQTAALTPALVAPSADAPISAPADSGAVAEAEKTQPAATGFDPADVAESAAALPPFPFFKEPEGLRSTLADKDRHKKFDREHMIAGDGIVAVEGKVFRDRFQLANPKQREYSEIEFHRNYADAVAALGGAEVSRAQYTGKVNAAFGGRAAVDRHYHGTCASDRCENHTYLIRQDGKEYWIQISTGAIPLHGEVVVLERQAMASKLAFLDAAAMKQKLDADGRVALYINFDTDKAVLRPDAAPVIDEIAKLLQAEPALKLSIDGHTDNTGSAEGNRMLSRERAGSVRAALLGKGIASARLTATGFGPDKPLQANDSEAGRAKNRRVELVKQ